MDITARALLVHTKIRLWSGEKRDRQLSRELCRLTAAAANAVRANKSLLGEAIAPVQAAERALRQAVNERTLPWMDDGTRILKGSAFIAFTEAMAAPTRGFEAAVARFIEDYPRVKEEARRRLAGAYDERDYPSPGRLPERFGVRLTYLPIRSAEDFRVALSGEEIATVRRSAEDAVRATLGDAVHALLERLREPMAHLATRLRLMHRNGRGKVEHPFRDTVIENLRAVVRLAPMLNLTDDARITELCADIEARLTVHAPDRLRASPALRGRVADEADAILERLQGAF